MAGAGGSSDIDDLLGDLRAEQDALQDRLRSIDADAWLTPTPARGWDVRDTVAHLADTDAMAIDTMKGGPDAINARAASGASAEDVTFRGVLRGRRLPGTAVLEWWEQTSAGVRDALREMDPVARIPWGIGMRAPSLVTARLMETWAHALDVHAALGDEPADTDRLAHVAWLSTRALPYAFSVAGLEMPSEPVRVELTLPSGAAWTTGPAGAENVITGPAAEYCRVFVHRLAVQDARGLRARGPAAVAALGVARAFL